MWNIPWDWPQEWDEDLDKKVELYERFLDVVEWILWSELSHDTRLKNINFYKTVKKFVTFDEFDKELGKKYEVIKRVNTWFIDPAIKNEETGIKSWTILLVPILDWENIKWVIFIKRKDTFWDYWAKIRKALLEKIAWAMPEPESVWNR